MSLPRVIVKHHPAKRIFDIFFSLTVLMLGIPIFLLIALAIKLSSKGSPIYSHLRIGRGGRPFKCYKFRTMYQDADNRLKEILDNDPIKKEEWDRRHKLLDDPRVTPIGKFLRKTSLDELPQFWNVLIGDLSVVGPRPVIFHELQTHFGEKAAKILSMRPGMTGVWQVSGRNDTSYETRVHLDEHYIDNRSMLMDIRLICKTIPCMFTKKGAY